ncbi:MAG: TRAP transporter small permease [Alphaproteobacteria bacterium]
MFLRVLDRLEEWIIASLVAAATLIIFAAVVHRHASTVPFLQNYALRLNMAWAQELCIYMFIWMAKFGAAYGVRTGIHVGVDLVLTRLRAPWHGRVVLFGLLAGALFTAVIASLGAHFVWRIAGTGQVSADMELPMWIVYLAVPCGSSLMCFRFLQVALAFVRTGHLPSHDQAQVEGVDLPGPQEAGR